jgi:peptidoglycan/LPS O-acetylase OafA/YrhL
VGLQRVPQLDGLRGIAILMVFLYHAADTHLPLFWSGVDLFFVLSGYLITGVLLRLKSRHIPGRPGRIGLWKTFYIRRALRIAPPYVGFLLAVSLVYPVPWSRVWYFYVLFNANTAALLQKVNFVALIPLWSLAVEEQFYFVWPFIVFLTDLSTLKRISLGMMVGIPLLRVTCTLLGSTHEAIYLLAPFRFDTLACGAYIAVAQYERPDWIRLNRLVSARWAIAAAVVFCVLSVSPRFRFTANSALFNGLGYSLILVVFGGTLAYVLDSHDYFVQTILSSKSLRYMGLISYTFYLYHWGVLSVLRGRLHSKILTALAGFAITGIIAALSWRFLEAPVLGLAHHSASDGSPTSE